MATKSSIASAASTAPGANQIIDYLRQQANTALAASLGSTPLVSFEVGGGGLFPYSYVDQSNPTLMNQSSYNWVNNNLLNNNSPVQQKPGSYFTNEMIAALSAITYQLSAADQATLNAALANATAQQTALLTNWLANVGPFPTTPFSKPIDNVMNAIATTWATPATTLQQMQNSVNLNMLLNAAPASGQVIMPQISAFLNAVGSSVSLQDAQISNMAYVTQALRALQFPAIANGGILTNDNSGKYYPGYNFTTPWNSIINGLRDASNAITVSMNVSIANSSQYQVDISGGASFAIDFDAFFSLGVSTNANYFHDEIMNSASSVNVQLTFPGLTMVNFQPTIFNKSTGLGWYFMDPINQALQNAGHDVTGFQFSPNPGIDFSNNGPFGITQGVAICNYPTVQITVQSSNYQSIQTTFQSQTTTQLSFLGIPLGGATVSTYQNSVSVNASSSTVTINLTPPPNLVAGTQNSSVGYILGVQTSFPAA